MSGQVRGRSGLAAPVASEGEGVSLSWVCASSRTRVASSRRCSITAQFAGNSEGFDTCAVEQLVSCSKTWLRCQYAMQAWSTR